MKDHKCQNRQESERILEIYNEFIPEHYDSEVSIVIKSKISQHSLHYDLISSLYDICKNGIKEHPHLKNVIIKDFRK